MNIAYHFKRGLRSARENLGPTLLTVFSIGAVLWIAALFWISVQTLESLAFNWGKNAAVVAYLKPNVPDSSVVLAKIKKDPMVESAVVVTAEQALQRMIERGELEAGFDEGVDMSFLPDSVEVSLTRSNQNVSAIQALSERLGTIEYVDEVDYGQQDYAALEQLIAMLHRIGLFLGILAGLAGLLIVANTIKLTVYARRDEIAIQKLVGATRWFVRGPFVMEGLLWGLGAGFLSNIVLLITQLSLKPWLSTWTDALGVSLKFFEFHPPLAATMLACGALLGMAGSVLSVSQFLTRDPL